MSRMLRCTRPIQFFRREFTAGEVYDIDELAGELGKDPAWLYRKMSRPMTQVGNKMVPCFVAPSDGADEAGMEEPAKPGPSPSADVADEADDVEEAEDNDEAENDDEAEFPKHTGGGWYVLSSGDKVKGRAEAKAAEAALSDDED